LSPAAVRVVTFTAPASYRKRGAADQLAANAIVSAVFTTLARVSTVAGFMTRKSDAIAIVDAYLRAGKSVCPHARKATIHYATDNEAFGPMLAAIKPSEAGVVIGSREVDGFEATKRWAQDTVLSMFAAAASLAYPSLSHKQVKDLVRAQAEPVLRNDLDPRRLYVPVRNQPVLPVCMAPVYPATHPRYSPRPIIVLTYLADVEGIAIPAVREAMAREHGHVYDAKELVLPLPMQVGAMTP
jgi:hypothetical protein